MMKVVFTTGQVAKICKVAPRTVAKWCDTGGLRGYRIPPPLHKNRGDGDRRIPLKHLIRFLKEHGMPLFGIEDEGMGKLLLVCVERSDRLNLLDCLPPDDWKVETANSGFDAGLQIQSLHPDCIVIDFEMGRTEAILIAENLRTNRDYADVIRIALLNDDDIDAIRDFRSIFNGTFRKPFDAALLAERIQTLVTRKKQLT